MNYKQQIKVSDDGEKILFSNKKLFLDEVKKLAGKWGFIAVGVEKPTRSDKQNRYMHYALALLVPEHFGSVKEAKDYYTEKYLIQVDVFEKTGKPDDAEFTRMLENFRQNARKTLYMRDFGDRIEIAWVKSTAALTTDQMEYFLLQFRTDVQTTLGITIPLPGEVLTDEEK